MNILCKMGWHKNCNMKVYISHDIARTTTKDNGENWSGHGWVWFDNYKVNDFFLIKYYDNYTLYKITELRNCGNPKDMFFYKMKHIKKKNIPGCVWKQVLEIGEKINKQQAGRL